MIYECHLNSEIKNRAKIFEYQILKNLANHGKKNNKKNPHHPENVNCPLLPKK